MDGGRVREGGRRKRCGLPHERWARRPGCGRMPATQYLRTGDPMAKTKATKRSKTAAAAVTPASLDALAAQAANERATIRRHYSREFKLSAVRLVKEQGYSVVAAARSLGVDDHNVRDWVNALGDEVGGPVDGEAALRVELHRLRRENARLLMERDILKKAAAYFAREQQ